MLLNGVSINDIYTFPNHLDILYNLLEEREPGQSISHKKMPTRKEHKRFVSNLHYLSKCPYKAWYFIQQPNFGEIVGTVYLTYEREIGVAIFKRFHRRGYGKAAVQLIMAMHPGEFLANINPSNQKSIEFFEKIGFKHIQNTYRLGQ